MSTPGPHPVLGEVLIASRVTTSVLSAGRMRALLLLLALCVGLQMTGYGIIMPVFARRLGEFESGVGSLGLMMMSFALAQLLSAPVMGTLADRIGRRPIILIGLAAFIAQNVGFLLVDSTAAFIAVRAAGGAFSAGIGPAVMGVVADIVPEHRRARWVGIMMGSFGAGFIFGPVLGGALYDGWGFEMPFIVSASLAAFALVAAIALVAETRTQEIRQRQELQQRRTAALEPAEDRKASLLTSLPKPLYLFAALLVLDFTVVFAFAFVEPQMVFYFYDDLEWSTLRFGVIVSAFGMTMVVGQTVLSGLSDRIGRTPVIVAGLVLTSLLYVGLATVTWFPLLLLVAIIAGLGQALVFPALSAFYLDITPDQHRSRVMGLKGSAASAGGVAGPLLMAIVAATLSPQGVFIIAAALVGATVLLAVAALRERRRAVDTTGDIQSEIARQRALAAQATLHSVVIHAQTARARRTA